MDVQLVIIKAHTLQTKTSTIQTVVPHHSREDLQTHDRHQRTFFGTVRRPMQTHTVDGPPTGRRGISGEGPTWGYSSGSPKSMVGQGRGIAHNGLRQGKLGVGGTPKHQRRKSRAANNSGTTSSSDGGCSIARKALMYLQQLGSFAELVRQSGDQRKMPARPRLPAVQGAKDLQGDAFSEEITEKVGEQGEQPAHASISGRICIRRSAFTRMHPRLYRWPGGGVDLFSPLSAKFHI